MKRYLFLLCSLVISSVAFAANSEKQSVISDNPNQITTQDYPQVCKFSIDNPCGIITREGCTEKFQVLMNCPLKEDVTVTVSVHIGERVVKNQLVTIFAGNKSSRSVAITLSKYYGQSYCLTVE